MICSFMFIHGIGFELFGFGLDLAVIGLIAVMTELVEMYKKENKKTKLKT